LTFPRATLPLPRDEMARVTGMPLSGRTGSGALVSSLLQRLAGELDAFTPSEAVQVSTAALDLVAAALATRLDARSALPPDVERRALMQRIYAFVDAHLTDLELSPSTVAAAHHVSVRQLHKLFESEECTVAGWIRRRRLDRCRRDLSDPALRHRPVGAIAARWGFADAAHFNRLFRALHGSPPGEYRLARLGGAGCTAGQSSCRRRQ
jgi:AraC-like DNA-binding protein